VRPADVDRKNLWRRHGQSFDGERAEGKSAEIAPEVAARRERLLDPARRRRRKSRLSPFTKGVEVMLSGIVD
jgi:hypothetical protein